MILGICRSRRRIIRSTDFEPFRNLSMIIENSFPDLVTIQDNNTVTFIHLSFKDYLQSQSKFDLAIRSGRQNITRACLTYLKLRDLLQSCADRMRHDGTVSCGPL